MFHDGVIDADFRQSLIFAQKYFVALRRIPGISNTADGIVQLRLLPLQLLQQCGDAPYKDTAVPKILAGSHKTLRSIGRRFLLETLDLENADTLALIQRPAAMDVAIARGWKRRRDTKGDEGLGMFLGHLGSNMNCILELAYR